MEQTSNDGYYFSKPKFQVYPYSQHDIPPANTHVQQYHQSAVPRQHYRTQPDRYQQAPVQHASQMSTYQNNHYLPEPQVMRHTAVELIPSQSFELKKAQNGHYQLFSPGHQEEQQQITAGYYEQPQQQHQTMNYHQQEETVPVIVLRIPGPQKYAAHLQALLQQYLEIRAAEYIKTLQEQEQQQEQHYHQQGHVASMGQQQQYYSQHGNEAQSATEHPHNHHESVDYHHQQPVQEDMAEHQSENDQHQQQHLSYDLVPPKDESQGQHDEQVQYQYVTIDQSETEPQSEHQHNQPQEQPHYVYGPPAQSKYQDSAAHLPVHENYPSSQHTHVYFPSAHRGHPTHQNADDESSNNQPRPFHVPVMYVQEPRHQYQQQDDEPTETDHSEEQHAQYYQQHSEEPVDQNEYNSASEHNVVTITQRSPVQSAYPQQPYNYHAHQAAAHRPVIEPTAYVSGPAPHSMSKGAKRQASALSNQQKYRQKINKLITGLKLKASSKEVDDSYEAGSDFKITVVRRH